LALGRPEDYLKRVSSRRVELYVAGERVENPLEHPVTRPVIETISKVYELTLREEYRGILTAKGLSGDEVSRFLHVERSADDLVKRVESQRIVNAYVGNCNYRCTGHDGINALYAATYEVDEKLGTDYHKRFTEYLKYLQANDLVVATAMTDVKGDRSKRPGEQRGRPLTYVHIVEERRDGIIVKGAKMHISGAALADEILVVPTRAMGPDEREYAVAFAVTPDTKGLYFVSSWNPFDSFKRVSRDLGVDADYPSPYGHRNTYLIIFDEVFVPRERVFLAGEYEYASKIVEYFIAHHRAAGAGCKAGFVDVILGAAALAADANGVLSARYIQEKLAEIKFHGEAAYAPGLAAAIRGWRHPSGAFIPDYTLANVAKLEAVNHLKEAIVSAAEIGGGIVVNAPSLKDLKIDGVGDKVAEALKANEAYTAEERLRAMRLLQLWTSGPHLVGLIQGGGPPATQWVALRRTVKNELPKLIEGAKRLAGIGG